MCLFKSKNTIVGICIDNKFFKYYLLIVFTLLSASLFSQNLVKNNSFETGNEPWLSKGDSMERHHETILKVKPVDGVYYAELANSKGYKLFQTVSVETGKYYLVSFYAQARPRVSERESHFVFTVNDEELIAKIQPILGKWQQYAYTVKANSKELTLAFEDTYFGAEGIGAMIDVVEVKEVK